MPHIIPDVMPFIMVHLTWLASGFGISCVIGAASDEFLPPDPQAISDNADTGERHRCGRDHRIQQAERRKRNRGDVVEKSPEQVLLDGPEGQPRPAHFCASLETIRQRWTDFQRLGGCGSGDGEALAGGNSGAATMSCIATTNEIATGALRMATAIAQMAMQAACAALSGPPPQSMP